MLKDKLYIKPVGGLCNRLRAIGSATIIAAQLNKRLVVFWGRDVYLNSKFHDLFAPSPHFDVIEERQWLGKKALLPYLPGSKPTFLFRKLMHWLTCRFLDIQQQIYFEDFDEVVAPLVKEVNPSTIKSMKEFENNSFELFHKLIEPLHRSGSIFICTAWKLAPWQDYKKFFVPISPLNDRIIAIAYDFEHTIGVHIRRSDHLSATTYSLLDAFVRAMECELANDKRTNFYLATDCLRTERRLKTLFGDKIRTLTKSSYDRNSRLGIQEGLIDLYVLARTRKILGSYYSSFSQVAAEISGIEETTVL